MVKWQPIRDRSATIAVDPHSLGGAPKVSGKAVGGRSCDPDIHERLVELLEAGLIELDMFPVTGMQALDIGFVAIASRVQLRSAKGFRKVSGQAFVMLGVQRMLEGVSCLGVLQTQLVPSTRKREYFVEPADLIVKCW